MSIFVKVEEIISKVIKNTGTHGVFAIDRMGDFDDIINHFTGNNRWLVTTNKNGGKIQVQAERLERHRDIAHKAQITKIDDGKETWLVSSAAKTSV